MQRISFFPLLVSSLLGFGGFVNSIVSETTRQWMTITQSGNIQRVPWQKNITVGLWETCYSYVSGFTREEKYSSGCYPTSDSTIVSSNVIKFCQASLTTAVVLSFVAVLSGALCLTPKNMYAVKKIGILTSISAAFVSVVFASLSISLFKTSWSGDCAMMWSIYVGMTSPVLWFLSAIGYIYVALKSGLWKTKKIHTEQCIEKAIK